MQTYNIREEAQNLLRDIPDDATWDGVMYGIYVRQAIEAGIDRTFSEAL
jgi:hypothetical protein